MTKPDPFDIDTAPETAGHEKKSSTDSPLRPGNKVLIRSVTHYYTGEIVAVRKDEIILGHAAWVADTGRFSDMLKSGAPQEVEPYPDDVRVSVGRGAIVDACDWKHPLLRAQK